MSRAAVRSILFRLAVSVLVWANGYWSGVERETRQCIAELKLLARRDDRVLLNPHQWISPNQFQITVPTYLSSGKIVLYDKKVSRIAEYDNGKVTVRPGVTATEVLSQLGAAASRNADTPICRQY